MSLSSGAPRVSVVVPSYNHARFVRKAVRSILDQTFTALEIIVVDDASTDNTLEVLQEFASDYRVRLVWHATNQGGDRTRNEGLALATGEYVAVMDSDDFCLASHAIARQVQLLDAHPEVGFAYSASLAADEQDRIIAPLRRWAADYVRDGLAEFADLALECYVQNSGTLVRRSCHVACGEYDPSLPFAGDWDRWLRFTTRYGVGYISEPLYAWRVHAANATHSRISPKQANAENLRVIQRAFAALPTDAPASLRNLESLARLRALLAEPSSAHVYGWIWRGWSGLFDAIRRSPGLLRTRDFRNVTLRLVALTLLGQPRYQSLARWRRARAALTHASSLAGQL